MNIKCRNRYIRSKAYRIACNEVGFVKVKVHDSWASQEAGHAVYRYDTERHPDFNMVVHKEIIRLRGALAVL